MKKKCLPRQFYSVVNDCEMSNDISNFFVHFLPEMMMGNKMAEKLGTRECLPFWLENAMSLYKLDDDQWMLMIIYVPNLLGNRLVFY